MSIQGYMHLGSGFLFIYPVYQFFLFSILILFSGNLNNVYTSYAFCFVSNAIGFSYWTYLHFTCLEEFLGCFYPFDFF